MTMMKFKTVVFDLDGTLIDSAPGILSSFEDVLGRAGISLLVPLDNSLIGPPLRQTLVTLTGISSDAELDILVEYFKDSYDSEGYKSTRVYDGVEELLGSLAARNLPMAIATNKRKVSTERILDFFGWGSYFSVVGTLDSISPPYPNKASLIGAVLDTMGGNPLKSLYIGDKREDGEAAEANLMPFLAVGWGYGEWDKETIKQQALYLVNSPKELLQTFLGNQI